MDKVCPAPRPFSSVVGSVLFLTLLFFLGFIGRFMFSPLMPTILKDVPMTPQQVGSVFFLGTIGVLVGSLAAGFVAARIAHRGTLLVSSFGLAAVLGLAYFAGSAWGLRAIMLLLGFFAGLCQPSVTATVTAMVDRRDWGKALSVEQAAPPLSLVAGPLLAVGLLGWFSWRVSLVWVGVLVALVGGTFLVLRGLADFPGERPRTELLAPMVRGRSFWLLILLFALGMGAQVGVYSMLPLYLTHEKGVALSTANTLLGLANVLSLAAVFGAGWISDHLGERATILGALVLTGTMTILVGALEGAGMWAAIFLLPAFAVCLFPPAFSALSRIVQPLQRGLAAALIPPLAFILGGGLLPIWLGYMGQRYTFSLGFVLTGITVIIGSVAAVFIKLLTPEEMEEGC